MAPASRLISNQMQGNDMDTTKCANINSVVVKYQ